MKLNLKAILIAAVAALVSASCAKESLELRRPGLENVDATKVELTTLVSSDAARVRPFYVYELKLSDAEATIVLDAKFVSDGQPLHAAVYTPASFADAHKNTYLTGENGTTVTVTDATGQVRTGQVVSGNIEVTEEAGAYTVSGVVEVSFPATAEGGVPYSFYYDLSWSAEPVAVKFKELPTLTKLTKVLSAQSNVANGANTVTVQLSSDGWESVMDPTTYQTTYTGKGAYLAVDFYSKDGYLAEGTYTASADPAAPKAGEFVVGYDTTMDFGWGPMEFKDWGTCWWTVDNAAPVAQKILSGEIFVAYNAKTKEYTIDIDNGTQYAKFVGAIPKLTKPEPTKPGAGSNVTVLPVLLGAAPQAQYNQVVLQIASEGVTATMDWTTWQTTYTGTGKILNLTIHAEADANGGTYIPTGKYDAADGTMDPFTWQVTGGNESMVWGTYIVDIVDGTPTNVTITEGTVWVGAKSGEYIINFESGDMKYRFTGAIEALSTPADDDGGYVGDDEGGFDGVELVGLGGYVDYFTMFGGNYPAIGLDLYSDGCKVTNANWQYSYEGTGYHLKVEFYTADGKVAPGVYEVGSTMGEGVCSAGSDMGGSEWFSITDGTPTSLGKIMEGTLTIEQDGDTYTVIMDSPTCKARYIGPIAPLQ